VSILILLYGLTAGIFYLLFTTEPVPPSDNVELLRLIVLVFMAPIFIKYAVQLLTAPCYGWLARQQAARSPVGRKPSVSVLIPAWNEEVGILKTMQSVLATGYEKLELIVINDGSTDGTHDLVSRFKAAHDEQAASPNTPHILYLNIPNGGKARALNQGLARSSGEFIITIDADSVMDPQAIQNLLAQFSEQDVGAAAGNVIVGNRKNPIALLQQLEYLYGFFFKRADSVFNSVYIIGGAAAAYRKSTLDAVGGFDDEIITEDIEMSTRILSHGFKTRYAADAVIYTEGPSDWKGLCQQRLRWKFGRILTFLKHKDMFFNRRRGSTYLTCLLLPVAVYAELSLMLEALLLSAFYLYTFITNDYLPLACVIIFMTALVCAQISTDGKRHFHRNILCLAPVAWIVFYVIDVVELQALYRSLKRLVKRQDIQWQSWARVGLRHQSLDTRSAQNSSVRSPEATGSLMDNIEQVMDMGGQTQG